MYIMQAKQPLSIARSVLKQPRQVATYESYICHRQCTYNQVINNKDGVITITRVASRSYSTSSSSSTASIVIPGGWQGGRKYYYYNNDNHQCDNGIRKIYYQRLQPKYFTANSKLHQETTTTTAYNTSKTRPEEGSLRDAVHKIQQEGQRNVENDHASNTTTASSSSSSSSSSSWNYDHILQKAISLLDTFKFGVAQTWEELINSGKPQSVNKVIHAPMGDSATSGGAGGGNVDNEAADKYDGVAALTIVKDHSGAWERMQQRLAEAPIIKDILGASYELYKKSGAQHAKRKLDDIRADATEAWETSQNPWVYRLSSVYDTITAESEFALATKELRRLDPDFVSLDKFKDDAMATMIPEILSHIMEGRTKELKPHLGEAVYNRLAAEIRVRKSEGLIVDPHILGIENSEILAAEVRNFYLLAHAHPVNDDYHNF